MVYDDSDEKYESVRAQPRGSDTIIMVIDDTDARADCSQYAAGWTIANFYFSKLAIAQFITIHKHYPQ